MMKKDMLKTLKISRCHCRIVWIEYALLLRMHAPHEEIIVCAYSHSKRVRDLMQFVHKTKLYCTPFIIEVFNVCVCECARVYFFPTHSPTTTRNLFFLRLFMQCGDPTKKCAHSTLHRHIHFVFL